MCVSANFEFLWQNTDNRASQSHLALDDLTFPLVSFSKPFWQSLPAKIQSNNYSKEIFSLNMSK